MTRSRQYAFPGDDLNAFDQAALQIFDLGFWIFDAILQVLGTAGRPYISPGDDLNRLNDLNGLTVNLF